MTDQNIQILFVYLLIAMLPINQKSHVSLALEPISTLIILYQYS